MKRAFFLKITGVLGAFFLVQSAIALVGGEAIPGSAKPEQVSKALTEEQVTATPQQTSITQPEEKPASPLGPEAEKIKFQLNGIILKGNHIYSDAELSQLYRNQLHKTISVADLFNIVQSITNYYRNNGYIISRAILPPQRVQNGVVTVQVIEGFIDQVNVNGRPGGSRCLVQAIGMHISECKPLQIKRMEKYLLLANEIPATQVRAVLSPSKTKTGAADLTLMTETSPITGYLSYDNYGTRYIGPQQMTASAAINSFIASGDATQFTITKTPKGGELTYLDLNYDMPIFDEGARLQMGGTRAHTHPLFVLRPSQIDGLNNNYYATYRYPVIRSRTETLTLQAGFNYLDSEVTTFDEQLYTDHIRSLGLGGTYNFADRWYGSNLIYADLRQGLPIFGYTTDTSTTAETSRPGGRADYTKIDLQMSRLQAIWGPISGFGLVKGQYAFNPLLASEQFTFGGSQLGRGYDVAEIIGDRGLAGSLELRYDKGIGRFLMQSLQFYVFYDIGGMWNLKEISGTPEQQSGSSTGAGVRFFATKYISGNLMWTQVLTKEIAAEELIGDGRRPRVFFSIVASLD